MARTMSLIPLILSSLPGHLPITYAQTSGAVCLPYYSWTTNTQGKTPCEVAASLLAVCSDDGTFEVLPLPDGQHYLGPGRVSVANPCTCNTMVFSLMTACGLCQGRNVIRWSEWSVNCPRVTLGSFPRQLPNDLRVPGWAYQDVRTNDVFDQFLARDNANATESSAVPVPSTTTEISTAPSLSTGPITDNSTSEDAPTQTASSVESDQGPTDENALFSNANKVGGSIVGALLGTALVVGLLVFLVRRRRARLMDMDRTGAGGTSIENQSTTEATKKLSGGNARASPSIRISVSAESSTGPR